MITLTPGSEDLAMLRKALEPLEGMEPLRKFVFAYANVDPMNGGRLTTNLTLLEGVLYTAYVEACAALNLQAADPLCAAVIVEDDDDE